MDQDALEKIRANLQLRNLVIEKALFGVLIAISAFGANYLLESRKQELHHDSELKAETIEAVVAIHEEMAKLYDHYESFCLAGDNQASLGSWRKEHKKLFDQFVSTRNRNDLFISYNLAEDLQTIILLNEALCHSDFDADALVRRRPFVNDLYCWVGLSCRNEIGSKVLETNPIKDFSDNLLENPTSDVLGWAKDAFEQYENMNSTESPSNAGE